MEAYIQIGNADNLPMQTIKAEIKEDILWWQKKGLSYTATGYGKKIPTTYKVKFNSRWYRVYCCIFSNIGTNYIKTKEGDIVTDLYPFD